MSVTSGFFNAINGDRRYNAEQMSAIFDGIINDGIFANIGTAFGVRAEEGNTITVGIGRAWFDSTWLLNDSILPLTVDISEILLDRIDAVVIEMNHTEAVRAGSIKIIKGTPATTPANPVMIHTAEINQYPLAYIYVAANSTVINQADITNMIGTSEAPYITGILQVQNIDNIVAQWKNQWQIWFASQTTEMTEAYESWEETWNAWYNAQTTDMQQAYDSWEQEWNVWFDDIKNALDGDTAGNLYNLVNEAMNRANEAFQSASDGKQKIATAITGKGVLTSSGDTFQQMADNIEIIETDPSIGTTNAIAADILAPKKAISNGELLTGTMVDRGTVNHALPINGSYTIPAGKHSGSGKVTQNIATKGAETITPGTTNKTIASGQYLNGVQTILGDADLVGANILSGKNIFGVEGKAVKKVPITGEGTYSAKYAETLAVGNLVTVRRHLGFDTLVHVTTQTPASQVVDIKYMPNSNLVLVALPNSIEAYIQNGDALTKTTSPISGAPTAGISAIDISADGSTIVVGSSTSPYLYIYKKSGSVFTRIASNFVDNNPVRAVAISYDGRYISRGWTGISSSERAWGIAKVNSDNTVNRITPSNWPTGSTYVNATVISPDGIYFAHGRGSNNSLAIHKRSGDTFTKLALTTEMSGGIEAMCFSPDGTYLAIGLYASPYVAIYKRSGDVFTKLANPTSPGGRVYDVTFSADGTYLAWGIYSGKDTSVVIYKRSGDTFTKLANPPRIFEGNSTVTMRAVAYNPLQQYFMVGGDQSSDYKIALYKGDILGDYAYKYKDLLDLYLGNYLRFGYAQEAGAIETTHTVVTIPIK